LRALVVVGVLVVAIAAYSVYASEDAWQIPVYVGIYAALVVVTFWRRVSYQVQIVVVVLLLLSFATFNLTLFGINAESAAFFIAVPFLTAIFFGRRGGFVGIAVVLLIFAVVAALFVSGRIVVYNTTPVRSSDLEGWVTSALVFLMMAVMVVFAQDYVLERLGGFLSQSAQLAQELEIERSALQDTVAERSRELSRRTAYLGATAAVAREAAAERGDIQRLLRRTVEVIAEQFGFYHVGLFMLDSNSGIVELRAASSEGGRAMLARAHRLRVGQGIVGTVAQQGTHRTALNVRADAAFVANPDLPETQSEMAVPLQARGTVIGVLDAQSTAPDAFTEEDATVIQAVADQVALAIDSARLFRQVEESVEAERRAIGELTRERWANLLQAQPDLGYLSDEQRTVPAGELWRDEMRDALRTGQVVRSDEDEARLAIPVRVRDQVVGVIDGRKRDGTPWSIAERELLEAMVEQLNVALEGAQLYREAQRRAARELRIAEITDRMRQSADMESLVRTTVEQLSALGRSGAFVQFIESPTKESRG